ncbi:MAG: tRNA lysidine(34) synthetase TilS, partial [Clostridia bacterium]|nr:tRNA lysidine(34) synthetase TilS [Clostridia bacterium]
FVTDSTNADTTYSRNRIRHDVIPSLRRINSSFLSAMERLSHSAAEDDECLRALAVEHLSEAETDGGYLAAELAALPPALRHRAVIAAISRRTGITPESRHIELLEGCIMRGSGAVELSDSFTASVKGGVLCIKPPEKAQERIAWQIPLSVPQAPLPDGRIMHFEVVGRDIYDEKVKNNKYIFKNALDYDIIFRNPVIRNRREGDFFSQAGRGVTKKLKKLLCEAKIPPRSRDALAMIDVSGDIAWLEGFGAAKNYCVTQDTKQILIVSFEDFSSKI